MRIVESIKLNQDHFLSTIYFLFSKQKCFTLHCKANFTETLPLLPKRLFESSNMTHSDYKNHYSKQVLRDKPLPNIMLSFSGHFETEITILDPEN